MYIIIMHRSRIYIYHNYYKVTIFTYRYENNTAIGRASNIYIHVIIIYNA